MQLAPGEECATEHSIPSRRKVRSWHDSPVNLKHSFRSTTATSSPWPSRATPTAYDRLVRRYYGFVRLKASSYFLAGGDSDDLIQEGLVGLYKAVRDYRTDRESSFRNFAELCITRQIITAVKTATRNKHTPLNQYVSFSQTPASAPGRRADARRGHPRPAVHDPVNQVISSEELQALVGCLSTALSELESRVLALYLDGRSYEEIGEPARLRHEDRRQRAPAREAQGRDAPARAGRAPEPGPYDGRVSTLAIVLIVLAVLIVLLVVGGLVASDRRRQADDAAAAGRAGRRGARPGPRPGQGLGARAASSRPPARPSGGGRTRARELHLVQVVDRPGTEEDQAVFDADGERLVLGTRGRPLVALG